MPPSKDTSTTKDEGKKIITHEDDIPPQPSSVQEKVKPSPYCGL